MNADELKKEVDEWLRSTDNHLNEEKTHFLSESEYAERAYLVGAEPREKRIAELIALINAERERQEKCDDVHLRKIAELEKENAELKDYRLTTLAKQQTDMSKYALNLEHKLSWYDDQLTKAKEILKAVVDFYPTTTATILCEAEKFISEVEK